MSQYSGMGSPLFIVGCDRSGTTLLSLILDQSRELNVTLESGFLPELKDRTDDYGDFTCPRQRWYFIRDLQLTHATSQTYAFDIFDISDAESEAAIRNASPTDYSGACRAVFGADAQKAGATKWANKTPKYVQHIDFLASEFSDAQFLHIIRDPRDVSASLLRAGWHSTYRESARYWSDQVRAGRESGRKLENNRYSEILYEDLVLAPLQEIEKLSGWLDLSMSEDALKFYEDAEEEVSDEHKDLFPLIDQPIDPSRAYAWKREMSSTNIADVEDVAGSLMEEIGYNLSGAKVSPWIRTARWGSRKAISVGRKVKQVLRAVK